MSVSETKVTKTIATASGLYRTTCGTEFPRKCCGLLLLLLLVGELWLGPPLAADPFMLLFVRSIKSNLILM